MNTIYFVPIAFLFSVIIGWLAIPRIIVIAKTKRLFDSHEARKVHSGAVPRLGGISFLPGAMISFSMLLGMRYYFDLPLEIDAESIFLAEYMFMMAGMLTLFFVGLADDLVGVGFRGKFVTQIFAAAMLVFAGLTINSLDGLFGLREIPLYFSVLLTTLFAVYTINAFNLIDGVDGLCSGTSTIVLSILGAWFVYLDDIVYAMMAFAMVGVVLVFFLYNILGRRLKIFMGDTGSLTLGYSIVFLGLKFLSYSAVDYSDSIVLYSPLSLLAGLLFVPLFDTLRVFVGRVVRHKSPFHPDKTHIHHKLLALGNTHLRSTATLLICTLFFCCVNIVMSQFLKLGFAVVICVDLGIAIGTNILLNWMIARRVAKNQ